MGTRKAGRGRSADLLDPARYLNPFTPNGREIFRKLLADELKGFNLWPAPPFKARDIADLAFAIFTAAGMDLDRYDGAPGRSPVRDWDLWKKMSVDQRSHFRTIARRTLVELNAMRERQLKKGGK